MTYTYALLLNADYRPIRILSWERAFALWYDGKVDLVSGYVDELVRSAREAFEKPAVVRLRRYVDVHARVRFNRQNVLARDGYECAYCGERPVRGSRPDLEALTLDHVVPRAQARSGQVRLPWGGEPVAVTSWRNVVTACMPCNFEKADRTPAQAGLQLRRRPRVPTHADILSMSLRRVRIPDEWTAFLPQDSPWRGYWVDELDPE